MDTVSEITWVWNGPEEVTLDQCDVIELRGAGCASLGAIWVQEHLRKKGRSQKKGYVNWNLEDWIRNPTGKQAQECKIIEMMAKKSAVSKIKIVHEEWEPHKKNPWMCHTEQVASVMWNILYLTTMKEGSVFLWVAVCHPELGLQFSLTD